MRRNRPSPSHLIEQHTPPHSRGASFCARVLHLCFAHPNGGGAKRRETFGCLRDTRWTCPGASKTRRTSGLLVGSLPWPRALGPPRPNVWDYANPADPIRHRYSITSSAAIRGTGRYGISGPVAVSLRLDVGRPDHLTPFLGFLSHQLSEFGWRHRHGLAGKLRQTGLQLRIGQYRVHRLI